MVPRAFLNFVALVCLLGESCSRAFQTTSVTVTRQVDCRHQGLPSSYVVDKHRPRILAKHSNRHGRGSTTSLGSLVDVPDGFFTITFAGLGLCLSVAKNFARIRMEENAWEQRLAEARRERLRQDPTLTELDLRRQEAAMEWSAYGKPRMMEEQATKQQKQQQQREREQQEFEREEWQSGGRKSRRRNRVTVADRNDNDKVYDETPSPRGGSSRGRRMSDREIEQFEIEFGIDYDPYYDDPYTEEELPEGNYKQDMFYGDRIYENGETFFMDKATGLYYRQGAKPRNINFFSRG